MERKFGRRNFSGGGGGARFVPVKEGEELDVKIEGIAAKGDGVAKKDGFVIFVPGAQLNEEIRIKITKVARKVAFAEKIGDAEGTPEQSSEEEPQADEEGSEPEAEEDSEFDTSGDSEEF